MRMLGTSDKAAVLAIGFLPPSAPDWTPYHRGPLPIPSSCAKLVGFSFGVFRTGCCIALWTIRLLSLRVFTGGEPQDVGNRGWLANRPFLAGHT